MNGKAWWKSKTLWVNLIAVGVFIVQMLTGFVVDVEAQAGILAVINLILRLITREPIDWGKDEEVGPGIGRIVPLILVALFFSGCSTVNISMNSGEKNAIKTDADATPTTTVNTSATVPLTGK